MRLARAGEGTAGCNAGMAASVGRASAGTHKRTDNAPVRVVGIPAHGRRRGARKELA